MNTTGKFNSVTKNQSFIDRFKTQITQNFGRSQIYANHKQSKMNISQLQNPYKQSEIPREEIKHQINGNVTNEETIYRCPICDRLRAICPYKSYQTYQYCQKCVTHQHEKKHQRPRIFSNATHAYSKELNSTFAETKGHSVSHGVSNLRNNGGIKNRAQVDKVRFVQSNNVYPFGRTNNVSQYQYERSSYENKNETKKDERPRATTQHVIKRPSSTTYHHVINQQRIVPSPPNIEEIIFYPVIHNHLVYKSAQKTFQEAQDFGKTVQNQRSRYQSHHSEKKNRKHVGKVVTDFMLTTKPDEILTPIQFKKLADSIYRDNNPNVEQQ